MPVRTIKGLWARHRTASLLAGVLVVALVLLGADRSALHEAERRASANAARWFDAEGNVRTEIEAFPFLPTLFGGSVDRAHFQADEFRQLQAHLTDVRVDATGVGTTGRLVSEEVTVSAVVPLTELDRLLTEKTHLPVQVTSHGGNLQATITDGDEVITLRLVPRLLPGIRFSTDPEPTDRTGKLAHAIRTLTTTSIPVSFIPLGDIGDVTVIDAGLSITGNYTDTGLLEGEAS